MRPSSSHSSRVPPDDPQQDGTELARQRYRLNSRPDESDSEPEPFASTTDGAILRKPSARLRFLSPSITTSPQAKSVAVITATSMDGPVASSSSRHAQPTPQSSHTQYDAQSDVDMTDTEVEESGTECDAGGAPLPLATHQIINSLPTPESGPEYLSYSDEEEYDYGNDDDDDENISQDEDGDDEMQPLHPQPNSLPPMSSFAPLPLFPHLGNAFFLQNSHPEISVEHGQQPIAVQPMTFSMPAGPTDLANLPPLPQPPPDWVPLPAFIADHNLAISHAIPAILGSENLGLAQFLRNWAYQGLYGRAGQSQPPAIDDVLRQTQEQPDEIDFTQLNGDEYDFQGLNWASMETTRKSARLERRKTYRNYVNRLGSDKWMAPRDTVSSRESFYRFKRMNIRKDVCLAHFQLRSVLACPTRSHAYYPTPQGIARMNLASRKSETFMSTRDFPGAGTAISTVDADCGVLMCGTFNGEYYIKSLDTTEKQAHSEGQISSEPGGITNHIKIHKPRRSCGPAAAIANNDHGFRLLDLETQKVVQEKIYPFALNCTAVSPDRRLRAVVGDHCNVLITNADTGEVLQELGGHRDYGFACDWSDDGWIVATGFQDMAVKIWDARRWCNSSGVAMPLCTVRMEMAGARNLRFSPLGSGPPVLVAAEEADFVNIIDAKMFHYKQEIDVFGEIGGVAFANDGQDLNVLCCDADRGGLLQLQRCRGRHSFVRSYDEDAMASRHSWLPDTESTPAAHKIPPIF